MTFNRDARFDNTTFALGADNLSFRDALVHSSSGEQVWPVASAGSGTVNWTGNPVAAGQFLSGGTAYGCSGTWSITVPAAHIGYQLAVTGLGGATGSVTVPVADAGSQVALDDNLSNDNGGNALKVSSNS